MLPGYGLVALAGERIQQERGPLAAALFSDRDLRMDSSVRSSSSVNCKGFGKGMTH
jgi:hypothetical protein